MPSRWCNCSADPSIRKTIEHLFGMVWPWPSPSSPNFRHAPACRCFPCSSISFRMVCCRRAVWCPARGRQRGRWRSRSSPPRRERGCGWASLVRRHSVSPLRPNVGCHSSVSCRWSNRRRRHLVPPDGPIWSLLSSTASTWCCWVRRWGACATIRCVGCKRVPNTGVWCWWRSTYRRSPAIYA